MSKLKKAIIPAAGLGTRFLPITKAVPKPMLSVLDKPTIQYIAEELTSVGIDEIIVVISPDSDVIVKHFGENKTLETRLISDGKSDLYEIVKQTKSFNVRFVVQEVANGLAGAILCAKPYVGDQPFALLLGDELIYAGKDDIERVVDHQIRRCKEVNGVDQHQNRQSAIYPGTLEKQHKRQTQHQAGNRHRRDRDQVQKTGHRAGHTGSAVGS